MPLHFKDAQGADISIGSFFWKDAAGAVTAISEGHVKFGNAVSQFWSSGLALSALPEGALVSINENGSPVNFYLAKHDYESGLNGAGRTLLVRKNLHSYGQWNANAKNAYATSTIDSWFNGTYKSMLDEKVKYLIGETTFYCTPGNETKEIITLTRGIFALSFTEYGLSTTYPNMGEGTVLPIASNLRVAYLNGTAARHWTRAVTSNSTTNAFIVMESGVSNVQYVTNQYGYRPAFTLPAKATVNPEPNADGSYTLLV